MVSFSYLIQSQINTHAIFYIYLACFFVFSGCMVGDKCIDDGASVVEENVCETFKCEAGEYKMIQKGVCYFVLWIEF